MAVHRYEEVSAPSLKGIWGGGTFQVQSAGDIVATGTPSDGDTLEWDSASGGFIYAANQGAVTTLASTGGTSLVSNGAGPALSIKGLTAGGGVALTPSGTDITISSSSALLTAKGELLSHDGGTAATVSPPAQPGQYLSYTPVLPGTGLTWEWLSRGTKGVIITGSDFLTDSFLPPGANGQVLSANSLQNSGLEWVDPGEPTLTTKGDVLTHDGAAVSRLPVGLDGQVLTVNSSAPDGISWLDSTVTLDSTGSGASLVNDGVGPAMTLKSLIQGGGMLFSVGTNDIALNWIGPQTTKGDLIGHTGVAYDRLPVGGDGQVLVADSLESQGLKWETPPGTFASNYGTFIDVSATVVPVSTAWSPYTGATAGSLSNVSFNVDAVNGDYLGVTLPGTYRFDFSVSFTSSGSNITCDAGFHKNNVFQTGYLMSRKIGTGSDVGSASFNGILTLAAGDQCNVRFRVNSGTPTVTLASLQFSLYQVSGSAALSPLTTKGDVWAYSTTDDRLPVGPDGYVIRAFSSTSTGLEWVPQVSIADTGLGVPLLDDITTPSYTIKGLSEGSGISLSDVGTNVFITWVGPATTKGDLLGYNGVSVEVVGVGSNGQVLTADSAGAGGFVWSNASPLTTKGDLYGFAAANARIPVGNDGQVLTADSADPNGVSWETPSAGAPLILRADQLSNPGGTSDWAVNVLAPLEASANDAALAVRSFDDSNEEGAGFLYPLPASATSTTIAIDVAAKIDPLATRAIGWKLYHRRVTGVSAPTLWSSFALNDATVANAGFTRVFTTFVHATQSMVAGETYQFELTRVAPGAGTDLTGDAYLVSASLTSG